MNNVKMIKWTKTKWKLNIRYTMYNVRCTIGKFDYRSFFELSSFYKTTIYSWK